MYRYGVAFFRCVTILTNRCFVQSLWSVRLETDEPDRLEKCYEIVKSAWTPSVTFVGMYPPPVPREVILLTKLP